MVYIGIDPGAKGGIAMVKGSLAMTEPYSDEALKRLCRELTECRYECICCLEKVGAMPGQGVVSMFSFGQAYGYIRGVLEAYAIPYQEVTPRSWKKEYGLNSDKKKSVSVCKKLFPKISLFASLRSKKEHDGMAEALLMAEYARRNLRKEEN